MSLLSYNGFTASPDPAAIGVDTAFKVATKTASGKAVEVQFPGGVKSGDVETILRYYEEQFFARVEPPITGLYDKDGDWGWEFRQDVNDTAELSCHASATATDTNATRHPDGSHNTFTEAQYKIIGEILSIELEHTLRIGVPGMVGPDGQPCGWTSDSTPDEMHVEVPEYNPTLLAKVAAKVRPLLGKGAQGSTAPANPQTQDGSITYPGLSVETLQTQLNKVGASPALIVDGDLGPKTTQAIREFQARMGLRIDGVVGPVTEGALLKAIAATKPRKPPAPYPLKAPQVFGTWDYPGTDTKTGRPWKDETRSGDPRFDGQSIRNIIKTIQIKLGAKWGTGFVPDGVYGLVTEAEVKKYQRANGLDDDGLLGPLTWKRLFG